MTKLCFSLCKRHLKKQLNLNKQKPSFYTYRYLLSFVWLKAVWKRDKIDKKIVLY